MTHVCAQVIHTHVDNNNYIIKDITNNSVAIALLC